MGKEWISRTILASIWRNFSPLMGGKTSLTALTVDNLSPAFQLLGIGLLVSTIIAFNELWPLHGLARWVFHIIVIARARISM